MFNQDNVMRMYNVFTNAVDEDIDGIGHSVGDLLAALGIMAITSLKSSVDNLTPELVVEAALIMTSPLKHHLEEMALMQNTNWGEPQ